MARNPGPRGSKRNHCGCDGLPPPRRLAVLDEHAETKWEGSWDDWYEVNRELVEKDPDLSRFLHHGKAGDRYQVGGGACATSYVKILEPAMKNPGRSAAARLYFANPTPENERRYRHAQRNGAGLGAFVGSIVGGVPGIAMGSPGVAFVGAVAGAGAGGYVGAEPPKKVDGAAGGAVGAAIFGPLGAALGGWLGGRKRKRRNPAKNFSAGQHTDMSRGASLSALESAEKARERLYAGDYAAAIEHVLAAQVYMGKFMVHVDAGETDPKAIDQARAAREVIVDVLKNAPGPFKKVKLIANPRRNPAPDPVVAAEVDGRKALAASQRALEAVQAGAYERAVGDLGATAYYIGAHEAHLLYDPGGDHTQLYVETVCAAAMNAMEAVTMVRRELGGFIPQAVPA